MAILTTSEAHARMDKAAVESEDAVARMDALHEDGAWLTPELGATPKEIQAAKKGITSSKRALTAAYKARVKAGIASAYPAFRDHAVEIRKHLEAPEPGYHATARPTVYRLAATCPYPDGADGPPAYGEFMGVTGRRLAIHVGAFITAVGSTLSCVCGRVEVNPYGDVEGMDWDPPLDDADAAKRVAAREEARDGAEMMAKWERVKAAASKTSRFSDRT